MRLLFKYGFWLSVCCAAVTTSFAVPYTLLNKQAYHQAVSSARADVKFYLHQFINVRQLSADQQIETIITQLLDTPYRNIGAMGEGDWQPKASIYQPGAVHLDQDPVYRLDGLDCQTFVQLTLAFLHSTNLNEFDRNIINIAYGAVDAHSTDKIHYYNRNHFVESDFNPVNQQNGFLHDVTSSDVLAPFAKLIDVTISRSAWLAAQRERPKQIVRVLKVSDADAMAKRFMTYDKLLAAKQVTDKTVTLSYLPKHELVLRAPNGNYQPNQGLFDLIPTPSIAEIVNDPKRWIVQGQPIKDVIGTDMSVSHFGVLYRKTFRQGELIYRQITCGINAWGSRQCMVRPHVCQQRQCKELMFAHATDMYPSHFYWYQAEPGRYVCSASKPTHPPYTTCNRVETLPFFSYLTNYQFGSYWYMNAPSILGVHVEKLNV